MPPIQLNRRRFLGGAAAAGWALSHGRVEAGIRSGPIRVGLIGLGNRGTSLLRSCLEIPTVEVVALADSEPKHLARGQGIVEKARGRRPEATDSAERILERADVEAVVVALPCDLHAGVYEKSLLADKHLYAEKPLGLTVAECDRLIAESARRPAPDRARRLPAAFEPAVPRRDRRDPPGRAGRIALGRARHGSARTAPWPATAAGWAGATARATGWSSRPCTSGTSSIGLRPRSPRTPSVQVGATSSAAPSPDRDVTDDYSAQLVWPDGFTAAFSQSWVAPADEAFTGVSLRTHRPRRRPRFRHRHAHLPRPQDTPPVDPPRSPARYAEIAPGLLRSRPLVRTPAASREPGRRPRGDGHRADGPESGG